MPTNNFSVVPYSLKNTPSLIERILPVQKLSVEAFKEQMAGSGKTLTALGSYWKGRKPLILAKACVLGCLLPATEDPKRDLEIFEKLMAMDDESFVVRWKRRPKVKEVLSKLTIGCITDYFEVEPDNFLPESSPIDWSLYDLRDVKINWRKEYLERNETRRARLELDHHSLESSAILARRRLEAQLLPESTYRQRVSEARRAEEVMDTVHDHIWDSVNNHLGTEAESIPQLVEQLGIMRFGHRPRMADTFCGSGQIPFEAARLGCDTHASDLNPIACMLTWGSFNIIGAQKERREKIIRDQRELVNKVQAEIDRLGVETDRQGWQAKVFLYCVEVRCLQSGWMVPLLPSLVISKGYGVIAALEPDVEQLRYNIKIKTGATEEELKSAEKGTIRREGKYGEAYVIHKVNGKEYKTKITSLRGDHQTSEGKIANRLRLWERHDYKPRKSDILQDRLYCIQWMRPKKKNRGYDYQFRSVNNSDMEREQLVEEYIGNNIVDWQKNGWLPDMKIEIGGPPRYQGLDLIRARGWTYWNHLFNPRQLLVLGLLNKFSDESQKFQAISMADQCSKLTRWNGSASKGAGGNTSNTFENQALNTQFSYAHRGVANSISFLLPNWKTFPLPESVDATNHCIAAVDFDFSVDFFITDPPYGDAVKYEEILDFFIAWLRKNPPPEFADWVWDSRRSLAIQGEGEDFRRGMVAAYKCMTECMPDNGIQVIMFTHQSGAIWADMANIVWASGLKVTAAWYVVTETDSVLRAGSHVKGTVLLVCRKRLGRDKTTRDDLAWEIQEEVDEQIQALTGLNQEAKGLYRDENVFEDADIQMAGYAAALRALTRYAIIDGRDMTVEAIRPRVKGETTFVDGLISFAVDTANQRLTPQGITQGYWDRLTGAERFYLKMLEIEARGVNTLDNYQNFAKAFKVRDFRPFMASAKANASRLKGALEFGRSEMGEGSELHHSVLRAVLYAMMELMKNVDGIEVLAHLNFNIPDYYGDVTQREIAAALADYLAHNLEDLRPEEAGAARVLRELIKNQRLG